MVRNHIGLNILSNQTHPYVRHPHSFGQCSRRLPRHFAPLKDRISGVVRICTVMFKIAVSTYGKCYGFGVTLLLRNIGKFLRENNASYLTVEGTPDVVDFEILVSLLLSQSVCAVVWVKISCSVLDRMCLG